MKRTLSLATLLVLACGEPVTRPRDVNIRPTMDFASDASTITSAAAVLDAGRHHTCALRQNGTVACWGMAPYGQMSIPAGESFTQVSAGFATTCGIRANGSVACYGSDGSGQINYPTTGSFTQISAGFYQVCALNTDQRIVCWGANTYGQSTFPEGTYKEISAGNERTCAVTTEGALVCVGLNGGAPAGAFSRVSVGFGHVCALRDDRSILCWGDNSYHQIDGAPAGNNFRQISAGDWFSCALRDDGEVLCWGQDGSIPEGGVSPPPAGPFVRVTTGSYHACAQRASGTVVCWGLPAFLNVAPDFQLKTVSTNHGLLDAGPYHTCAARPDGSVACWGHNPYGQQNIPSSERPTMLSGGFATTCSLRADASVVCYGSDGTGQNNVTPGQYKVVNSGYWSVCGIKPDNTIACWGGNVSGQISEIPAGTYKDVSGGQNVNCVLATDGRAGCTTGLGFQWQTGTYLQISTGTAGHVCAIRTDGTLACWGSNNEGQRNNIPGGVFTQVSSGAYSTCAMRENGELTCWGLDVDGSVSGVPSGQFVRLTTGALHGCAQRSTGKIVCWGRNDLGQRNIPPDLVEPTNSAPTANAGGPYFAEEGSVVSFDASLSMDPNNDALTYTWDFGDGTTGSGVKVDHAYADDAVYNVSLSVSDGSLSSQASATATVTGVAPRPASLVHPSSYNEGDTPTLTVGNVIDPSSADVAAGFRYSFDCGTGFGPIGPTNQVSCPNQGRDGPSTFVIKVRIHDKDGAYGETSSASITVVNVAPTISYFAISAARYDATAVLRFADVGGPDDAVTPGGFKVSVDWNDGVTTVWNAPIPATGQFVYSPVHTYPKGGFYDVAVTVEDKDGGRATTRYRYEQWEFPAIAVSPATVKKNTNTLSVGIAGSANFDPRLIDVSSIILNNTPVATFKGQPMCATKLNATTGFYDMGCQFDVDQMKTSGNLPVGAQTGLTLRGVFAPQGSRFQGVAYIVVQ